METTKLSISCWFFCFLWEIKSVVIPTTRICSLGDQTGYYQLLDDYSTPVHYSIFSWQGCYFVEQLLWNEFRFPRSFVCHLAVLSITSCPLLCASLGLMVPLARVKDQKICTTVRNQQTSFQPCISRTTSNLNGKIANDGTITHSRSKKTPEDQGNLKEKRQKIIRIWQGKSRG